MDRKLHQILNSNLIQHRYWKSISHVVNLHNREHGWIYLQIICIVEYISKSYAYQAVLRIVAAMIVHPPPSTPSMQFRAHTILTEGPYFRGHILAISMLKQEILPLQELLIPCSIKTVCFSSLSYRGSMEEEGIMSSDILNCFFVAVQRVMFAMYGMFVWHMEDS